MPALKLDLTVEQGTTWTHGFIPKINGTPVLVADWTARGQIRNSVTGTDVLYEWSTETGNLGIDLATGAVIMYLEPAETSAWTWRSAVYDLEVTSPDGLTTYRVAQGKIKISPEVTR